mmetsp:Transcript_65025/g.173354  ORF Transcript_65025/g.173354 Transcript_65025/m.173354 type:complete len:307 (-) Transcript_65025:3-923(-)
MILSRAFYQTYSGHRVSFLRQLLEVMRKRHGACIYLAGDSSLDNKYWIDATKSAVNGYEEILDPPRMKADVCYWLNVGLAQRGQSQSCFDARGGPSQTLFALNTAIEASTLRERVGGWLADSLLEQDQVIRDTISADDYLVVSIGGNDIALAPTLATILNILTLVYMASDTAIQDGSAWGLGHFIGMFRDQLCRYIELLVERQKPRKVLVCMIYYPDMAGEGSWADTALSALSYNSDPRRLQAAIASVFEFAVSQVRIEGTEIVPVPLFRTLDGTDTADYVDRVEPSEQGGRKMAEALLGRILESG